MPCGDIIHGFRVDSGISRRDSPRRPEDVHFAFEWAYEHARTREDQELVARALICKCDVLWAQLDALYFAYVEPGWPPPGAFRPE